jgi:hypothetical protein
MDFRVNDANKYEVEYYNIILSSVFNNITKRALVANNNLPVPNHHHF